MCGECGETFALSARREYAHRVEGKAPKCSACRRPRDESPPPPAMYAYWLERFSLDEIEQLGHGIWGPG